jgi:hypothetical protein
VSTTAKIRENGAGVMADMTKRRDLLQNLIDKVEFAAALRGLLFFLFGCFLCFPLREERENSVPHPQLTCESVGGQGEENSAVVEIP